MDALDPITTMTPEVVAAAFGDEGARWLVDLQRRVDAAEARAAAAEARVKHIEGELSAAQARFAELEKESRQLKARLGKDSSNSSRPPSSDGPQAIPRRKLKA